MKFSINSKLFLSMVSAVGKLIPSKPVILIQGSFLISVHNGVVEITASDADNQATITENCETEGEGKVCIEGRFLTDLLNSITDTLVTVAVNNETYEVDITTATGAYNTIGISGSEYPLGKIDETPTAQFQIPTEKLAQGLSDVSFAVSTDDFHPTMLGVCMDVNSDNVTFCATDTRQLARSIQSDITTGVEAQQCILSQRTMSGLNALMSKVEVVDVIIYPTFVEFSGVNFTLRSQLIKGRFPDYNRVIPKSNDISVTIPRNDFINVLRRVSICSEKQYNCVKLQFVMGLIEVSAQDTTMGKRAKDTVTCDYNGPQLTIGFSSKLLTNILKAIPTENVLINLKSSNSSALIQPTGEDRHLTLLLMPMNID